MSLVRCVACASTDSPAEPLPAVPGKVETSEIPAQTPL
jgi:hypothetical protein